jgi:hypothetical protein
VAELTSVATFRVNHEACGSAGAGEEISDVGRGIALAPTPRTPGRATIGVGMAAAEKLAIASMIGKRLR